MKTARANTPRDRTRRAILDATADVIVDTNGIGFSVQAVADRAGLTHRTVYNHFPTREALCEGFSQYVDELLATSSAGTEWALHLVHSFDAVSLESLPATVDALYRTFGL